MKKGFIGGVAAVIILAVGAFMIFVCSCKVPAGFVAVQYSMNGGVKDEILTQGYHLVAPTTKTSLYTVGLEQSYLTKGEKGDSKEDESFSASSSEGKAINIDLTFTYQYKPEDVTKVFNKFKGQDGKEVRDTFIKPNIVSWTKEVVAKYPVADILGSKRADINVDLSKYLSKKFEPYGITISNVSLIDLSVDAQTQQAINDKIKAQQAAEQQAIENQTNIDKAKAEAEAKITKAQANAEAKLIEAKAQAEANELLNKSLNDKILQQQWNEKWNGELPQVVGGDNASTILNMQ